MGLVSRAIEEAGIPTITMSSAWDVTRSVKPPRAAFVNFPLGNQTGRPGNREEQMAIVRDALTAAYSMTEPGTVTILPYEWDEDGYGWQGGEYRPGYLRPYVRTEAIPGD